MGMGLWSKASRKQKPPSRITIRWDLLGLHDRTGNSSTLSIEEIRRQIIAASNYGLSPDTLARVQTKTRSAQRVPKVVVSTQRAKPAHNDLDLNDAVAQGGHHRKTRKNNYR